MRKSTLSSLVLIGFCALASSNSEALAAAPFDGLDQYQGIASRADAEKRLAVLLKDDQIKDQFKITDAGIAVYDSLESKTNDNPEYFLKFSTSPTPLSPPSKTKSTDPFQPLSGLRIAIDPGHFGGKTGKELESRYIDIGPRPDKGINTNIQFDEGTLAFLTAKHLQSSIEKLGATVLVSKDKIEEGAHPLNFTEWKLKEFQTAVDNKVASISDPFKREETRQWWLKTATDQQIFRSLYNPEDLKYRADKINQFSPDLTLMLHYNAAAGNLPNGQNIGSDNNYSLTFVPGAFMKGELSTQEARANFLRLLVTNHLDNSIRASKEVASSYRNILGVRSVDEKDANDPNDNASGFLKKSCTFVDLGVYARNLGLTRLVQSPLCYGEAFCQDNFSEALRLADESESVAGIKTSKRILETSDAYLAAILKFFGAKNVTQTELNEHCFTGPNQAISNVNSVIRKVPKVSDFTQPNLAIGSGSTR